MAAAKKSAGKSAKMLDPTAFRKELDENILRPAYLLDGDDGFIRQRAFTQLRELVLQGAMPELNEHVLTRPDGEQIAAAANIPPMMADRRLVVVRDYEGYPSKKKAESKSDEKKSDEKSADADDEASAPRGDPQIDKLLAYLDDPSPSTVLVFIEPRAVGGTNKLLTKLSELGGRVRFDPMDHALLVRWIAKVFRDAGCACSPAVAEQLIFTCGNDAGTLYQQAQKLAVYAADTHEITAEQVASFASRTAESSVFTMIDRLMQGRKSECFQMMLDLKREGTSSYALLAMLQSHFRALTEAHLLLESRVPAQEYASRWGVQPFAATKRIQQAKLIGQANCRSAFELCVQTEYRLKSGRRNEEGMIEALMLQLFALTDKRR